MGDNIVAAGQLAGGNGLNPAAIEGKLREILALEAVIVVDLSFRVVAVDRGAENILGPDNGRALGERLPFKIPAAVEALARAKSYADLSAAKSHVRLGNRQYSCRFFLLEPRNGSLGQPLVAVHLKREVSVDEAVGRVARAYRLTDREQQAVIGVSMGLTSKELADRMNISPNTVNAFLRLIMIKMGVTTRAGVVGKLLDESGGRVARAGAGSVFPE
jgi:DNA-binding CsgD family transcriptional regulator